MTRPGDSSPLLGIGEFARAASLSVSAVRFYADRGLLVPAQVDPSTGYRFYSQEQVGAASLIRDLRRLGMSLAEITTAMTQTPAERSATVVAHIAQLETDVERAREVAGRLGYAASEQSWPDAVPTIVRADELRSAFEQVLPLAATDPELPHLMTVRIESRGGSVRIVATDTHRVAVRDLVPISIGEEFVTLIAAATVRRLLPQLALFEDVALDLQDNTLSISSDAADLSATIVPASYPDYEPYLVRPANATALLADRAALRDALEMFEGDDAVLLSSSGSNLRIQRSGQIVDLKVDSVGPDVHVAINPKFGIDGIDGAIAAEQVLEIEDDPLRPVVFRSATDGTYVSVLMPVQL